MKTDDEYSITTEDVLMSIKYIDDKISMAKCAWRDASADKKSKWMDKINALLDDRLDLMALRDKYCSGK
jgi:hypothetical protein